jgi:NADPH-dependent F420 reductase
LEQKISDKTIAILGGTGKEGRGLAYRWAKIGYQVFIGSRQKEKAEAAATDLNKLLNNPTIIGLENNKACEKANVIVVTVPYQALKKTLSNLRPILQGKIVIDVVVPLIPPHITKIQLPPDGSAGMEAQHILGPDVRVCSAFQNISYDLLLSTATIQCDVLVCGSDQEAKLITLQLVRDAGLVGWDAGPLDNSLVAEGLTSILIGINKKYGSTNAGIKITGVERLE